MPIRLTINVHRFFDGTDVLPNTSSVSFLPSIYFEVALRCASSPQSPAFAYAPFRRDTDTPLVFDLYKANEVMPASADFSDEATAVRMPPECHLFHIHVYKIHTNKQIKRIGMMRHISKTSENQDEAFFGPISIMSHIGTSVARHNPFQQATQPGDDPTRHYIEVDYDQSSSVEETFQVSIPCTLRVPGKGNRVWDVPRNFYSSMNYAHNFMQRTLNTRTLIEDVLLGIHAPESKLSSTDEIFTSPVQFIRYFASVILENIEYSEDIEFSSVMKATDLADAYVEFTATGDCEDFVQYFMRMLIQFQEIMPCIPAAIFSRSGKYKKKAAFELHRSFTQMAAALKKNYVPMCYICQIKNSAGQLEYHSTVMLVAREAKTVSMGVELTAPEESALVTNRQFEDWHKQSLFLLTANHYYTFPEDESMGPPSHKLTVADILPSMKDY